MFDLKTNIDWWHPTCLFCFGPVIVVVVTILIKPTDVILAAAPELLPVRILAGIALVAVIVAFVHVLRHLKRIEQTIVKDESGANRARTA